MLKNILILLFISMAMLVTVCEAGQTCIMYDAYVWVEGSPVDQYTVLEEVPEGEFIIMPDVIIIGEQHCEVVQLHEMEAV